MLASHAVTANATRRYQTSVFTFRCSIHLPRFSLFTRVRGRLVERLIRGDLKIAIIGSDIVSGQASVVDQSWTSTPLAKLGFGPIFRMLLITGGVARLAVAPSGGASLRKQGSGRP